MSDGAGSGGDAPVEGWYEDPEVPGQLRWWDGVGWTEHTRPAPGAAGPTDPGTGPSQWGGEPAWGSPHQWGGPASGAGWGTGGQPSSWGPGPAAPGQQIDPWLWQSIVATIFCCQPLGIVGIVFASQAQTALAQGDLVTAQQKASSARTWTLVSIGVVAGFLVLWVLFMLLGFAASFGW